MCGRFTQRPSSEIAAIFAAEDRLNDEGTHFNVAPTQRIAVVVERPDNERAVVGYRWGLVPSWTDRTVAAPTRMFNARSETVALKPAFRGLLAKHRLIVPADGFYEWRRGPDLARQPYYIRLADGKPLALAGLWASWHDPDRPRDPDPLRSATILTTVPNSLLGQIHNRMPVILPEFDWDRWLDPTLPTRRVSSSCWRPHPTICSKRSRSGRASTRPAIRAESWSKRSARRLSSEIEAGHEGAPQWRSSQSQKQSSPGSKLVRVSWVVTARTAPPRSSGPPGPRLRR